MDFAESRESDEDFRFRSEGDTECVLDGVPVRDRPPVEFGADIGLGFKNPWSRLEGTFGPASGGMSTLSIASASFNWGLGSVAVGLSAPPAGTTEFDRTFVVVVVLSFTTLMLRPDPPPEPMDSFAA